MRGRLLQTYCELFNEQVPAHALRVHARLATGSTILLLASTPLQQALNALSFYVTVAGGS